MSYHINRAMGYGMEWNKFEELTALGILDDAGVNALRPMIAQWWC